jgi:hypothetical protein
MHEWVKIGGVCAVMKGLRLITTTYCYNRYISTDKGGHIKRGDTSHCGNCRCCCMLYCIVSTLIVYK